jgi:glycosyltransferase involved in cell wall biosynthesis
MRGRYLLRSCAERTGAFLTEAGASKHRPSVGTVVPAYNARATVEATLESLFRQDYDGEHRVVLVDDGSTDGTLEHVSARFASRLQEDRLTLLKQQRRGVGAARNAGFRWLYDRGYALYCQFDADDIATPNRVADLVSVLERRPDVEGAVGKLFGITWEGGLYAYPLGGPKCWGVDRLYALQVRNGAAWDRLRRDEWPILAEEKSLQIQGFMFRRSALERLGPENWFIEDKQFGEDWDFYSRVQGAGARYGFADSPVGLYRMSTSGLTWKARRKDEHLEWYIYNSSEPYWQAVGLSELSARRGGLAELLAAQPFFRRIHGALLNLAQAGAYVAKETKNSEQLFYYTTLLWRLDPSSATEALLNEAKLLELHRLDEAFDSLLIRHELHQAFVTAIQMHALFPSARTSEAILRVLRHPQFDPGKVERGGPGPIDVLLPRYGRDR